MLCGCRQRNSARERCDEPGRGNAGNDRSRDGGAVPSAQPVRMVGAGGGGSDSRGARASGVHFWTPEGKRYIDFNSQLMCVNAGHGHPAIIKAIQDQAAALAYTNPFMASEARARLGAKLAEITPGDMDVFFFTNGGAECNENAIRIARAVTGRHKILARYRSYHGGTAGSLTLTGDPRRWAAEPGIPGVVHVLDPVSRHAARLGHGGAGPALPRGGDRARGAEAHRRVHPRDHQRHQRHHRPAGRLPAGRARAVRQARHPDDLRRGDGRLRPHRQVVRRRSLEGRAGPDDHGQGPDERLRAAWRRGHAPRYCRSLQGEGLQRRPHLQQPPAWLRHGAGHDQGLRGRGPDRERREDGRRDGPAAPGTGGEAPVGGRGT